jgi:hypothetical protein
MNPKTRDHIECGLRNETFARWILALEQDRPDQSTEWGVVAAFYAAVHLVNAYLQEVHQFDPRNHHQRQSYVRRDPVLAAVQAEYRSLADMGWAARYDPSARTPTTILVESVANLESIKTAVLAELE